MKSTVFYRVEVDSVTEWTGYDSEHAGEVFASFKATRKDSDVVLLRVYPSGVSARESVALAGRS